MIYPFGAGWASLGEAAGWALFFTETFCFASFATDGGRRKGVRLPWIGHIVL